MSRFADRLRTAPVLLADGGIETRLIYEFHRPLPDFASFLPLFTPDGRADLTAIYRSYMQVALDYDLPMQVGTPTWRAHPEGLARQGFSAPEDVDRVNGEAAAFLRDLRGELGAEDKIFIAGVVGPRRDGYDPHGAPDATAAERYHTPQARSLAAAGVDLLYAPTFASSDELLGVARAFAACELPYVLAPVIGADGRLPDGTPLGDAIEHIDTTVSTPPLHFLIGCVHPSRFAEAEAAPAWPKVARVAGLKANASTLPPEELDKLDHLDEGKPEVFADLMAALHARGLKVMGGCCGTSDAHIRALAQRLAKPEPRPAF
ncbi:homocysteine S-methyltransferase [Enhydrobacter aerosaccus]|uniref:Homocysteine S-methyltransferase n=1 Tax=Enhydrobacter aerosaccus TaxID=225324 RepID=A0A1T4PV37_9HYPH|nr:homocysteine S-methyltransferase family protein [Enhydrobacter aerosaccus]SJZ95414.1 homocysteine S-methyltransferase [Enhydrobacter aerosaccus]